MGHPEACSFFNSISIESLAVVVVEVVVVVVVVVVALKYN
jgi:hypothetical protein